MKILLISFYWPPDLSAGSFRASALVQALVAAEPEVEIEVVTTTPNRYASFAVSAPPVQRDGNVLVNRFALPRHQSGMLDQSLAFAAYARRVVSYVRNRRYDLVIASSARLMPSVLGAWVARGERAPLYLDIRDIFTDTIGDILPRPLALVARFIFTRLENWAMARAARINLVSEGFRDYFQARFPAVPLSFFTNGIDDEFLAAGEAAARSTQAHGAASDSTAAKRVVYAGNVGEGQGLHLILPQLAQRLPQVNFVVIGDGGRRGALAAKAGELAVANLQLRAPMRREELIKELQNADVLFLHLNDYPAFLKVLPSKLFEYAALGKPIWAGVGGHAAQFLRAHVANAAVFAPCNVPGALDAWRELRLEYTPRRAFVEQFARRAIMSKMAAEVLQCARARVQRGALPGGVKSPSPVP